MIFITVFVLDLRCKYNEYQWIIQIIFKIFTNKIRLIYCIIWIGHHADYHKINCCRYVKRFRLTIEEKGQGMTSEELHKIGASVQFNRTLYEQQGSGMGLSIARMIIEMYGGELLIESELHKGTSITIFLNAPTL